MRFCVFDLDHTLLNTNISFRYYLYLLSIKHLSKFSWIYSLFYLFLYKLRIFSLKTFHIRVFKRWVKSKNYWEFIKPVEFFLEKNFSKMTNEYVLNLLKKHQEKEDYIVLFSSSPSFLVLPIAKKLGFHAAFGTQYKVDKQGKVCQILTLIDGEEKASIAKQFLKHFNIPKHKMTVYTDSLEDLPLMKMAGSAFLIKSSQKKLFE